MCIRDRSKPMSLISFIVSSKSFSVSPGKPMMKSEEMLISGRIFWRRLIFDLYSSAMWPRFIAARIRSDPLWTGRCKWLTSSGTSAYSSINESLNSTGCDVVKRILSMPSIEATIVINSAKSMMSPSWVSPWNAFTFWPNKFTSRTPSEAKCAISVMTSSTGRLTSSPRV